MYDRRTSGMRAWQYFCNGQPLSRIYGGQGEPATSGPASYRSRCKCLDLALMAAFGCMIIAAEEVERDARIRLRVCVHCLGYVFCMLYLFRY